MGQGITDLALPSATQPGQKANGLEEHYFLVNSSKPIDGQTPSTGYVKAVKYNTGHFVTTKGERYMIKLVPDDSEKVIADKLSVKGLPILPHYIMSANINGMKQHLLVRGPTTALSLGDLVYKHLMGEGSEHIPDRSDMTSAVQKCAAIAEMLRPALKNLEQARQYFSKHNTSLPVTLDNIDCNGMFYDFGDYGTGEHKFEVALADFCRFWSLSGQPIPYESWFPADYETLYSGTFQEKVMALNNNLLHAPHRSTSLFVDEENTTSSYFNPLFGHKVIDKDLVENSELFIRLTYQLQDPGYRVLNPVYSVTNGIYKISEDKFHQSSVRRPVFYRVEDYEEMERFGLPVDEVFKYTFFQGSQGDTVNDFAYYNYQANLFLQPHILKYLYEQTLKDFQCVRTNHRFSTEDCKPSNSSLGPSHPTLRAIKQKAVYTLATEETADKLIELAENTPLIFTTKLCEKFALTAKPRARTVSACSMFASTLFRAVHKPVTAKFVTEAQNPESKFHCLIGVSKFGGKFDQYFRTRHGDPSEYLYFGSDYTKCDRTFPFIFRAAAAAILFELGEYQPQSHLFVNELQAFVCDFVLVGNDLYQKPGGTSSGDATTAYANSIYNHMVHLYVELMTIASSPCQKKDLPLKVAASQVISGYGHKLYSSLIDEYHATEIKFNFLSDDSFIMIHRDTQLPPIFNCDNFSAKLETLIHAPVDRDKSWQGDSIHEFCSAHIQDVNGVLQHVPDKIKILASLIIVKDNDDTLALVRSAALLMEAAVFSSVDPYFWKSLFAYFLYRVQQYECNYGISPLPSDLRNEEFYRKLITPSGDLALVESYLSDYVQLQGKSCQQCIACSNITVSCCLNCFVPYPMCAKCAYIHHLATGHQFTNTPSCHVCQDSRVECLNACIDVTGFKTACHQHTTGLALPVLDHKNEMILLPYATQSIKQNCDIEALNTSQADFKWKSERTRNYNILSLIHHSNLAEEYSAKQEKTHDYTVDPDQPNILIFDQPPGFGYTTYVNIINSKGISVVRATLDPKTPTTFFITTEDRKYLKYNQLKRVDHQSHLVRPVEFEVFSKANFVIGPPGTGKTTFFKKNFFHQDSFNKIVYVAPTHSLVQDMSESLKDQRDVTVWVSKYNNRVYHHPLNEQGARIILCTTNVVKPSEGCTLLIDECSLSTPTQLVTAIKTSKCSRVYIVGDPFQLAPVLEDRSFSWDYDNFWLRQLVNPINISFLTTCYRCPSNILRHFVKPYQQANIPVVSEREGGEVEKFEIPCRVDSESINTQVLDQVFQKKYEVVLSNYKAAVVYGQNRGHNIMTVDSAQGRTYANVALVIFGHTNFSKVVNRLIVAMSRTTQKLHIYANKFMMKYLVETFDWPENVEVQCKRPTYRLVTPTEVDIKSSGVSDIEFFHVCPNDSTPKSRVPNYLGIGEVTIYTSGLFHTFLRPRYLRDGKDYEVPDRQIFTHGIWKYMLKHLPTREVSDLHLNTMLHFLCDTTNLSDSPFTFILFNGKNDIEAFQQIFSNEDDCHCGGKARFLSTEGALCQAHVTPAHVLTHICCPNICNINEQPRLEVAHAAICDSNHGDAHSSTADTYMTACVFSSLISPAQYTGSGDWTKCQYSPMDRDNRLYGRVLYLGNEAVQQRQPRVSEPPLSDSHSTDYVLRNNLSHRNTCHPTSQLYTCIACQNTAVAFRQEQFKKNKLGYEYAHDCYVDSKAFRQYKLEANVIEEHGVYYVEVGSDTAQRYEFDTNLNYTLYKISTKAEIPTPTPSVIKGLGITATYNLSIAGVHATDTPMPYHVLLTSEIVDNVDIQYLVTKQQFNEQSKASRYAAFRLGLDDQQYVNRVAKPAYWITKFVKGQPVSLGDTCHTTGRLVNNSRHVYQDEKVFNEHIDIGEQNEYSFTIGGKHMYPIGYLDEDVSLTIRHYNAELPFQYCNVVAERGVKQNNSVTDVNVREFHNAIKALDVKTLSIKTTISIDYQDVPIMVWYNTNGSLATAYLQRKDDEQDRYEGANGYIIWPTSQYYPDTGKEIRELTPPHKFTQARSYTKAIQICQYLNERCSIPANPSVLNLGASSGEKHNYLPLQGYIYEYFFGRKVDHFDLRDINTRPNVCPSKRYDVIISDLWANHDEENPNGTDHTEYFKNLTEKHLNKGGIILVKTTRYSTINTGAFVNSFGKIEFFSARCMLHSSEVWISMKYYSGPTSPNDSLNINMVRSIYNYRTLHGFTPSEMYLSCLGLFKPHAVVRVPPFLESQVEPKQWQSGKIIQNGS
ncbi:ORF1B [Serpentovirinae sp. isolate C18]|nr:ORF1B [Serpentovirinae sp.]QFU19721.1 ORF1B [Serpentovirinae sp.]